MQDGWDDECNRGVDAEEVTIIKWAGLAALVIGLFAWILA